MSEEGALFRAAQTDSVSRLQAFIQSEVHEPPKRILAYTAPELTHYTTWPGLEGMLHHGTIWASRYDCLNDSTEVVHLRDTLVAHLAPKISEGYTAGVWASGNQTLDRWFEVHLDWDTFVEAATPYAAALVDAQYITCFKGIDGRAPYGAPFIASFCNHSFDGAYIKRHGLLSQWRSYGGDAERFAIVFDTIGLYELLDLEMGQFRYMHSYLAPVIYNTANINIDKQFVYLLRMLAAMYMIAYDDASKPLLEQESVQDVLAHKVLVSFVDAAARFKHQAFFEEREVRVIAGPVPEELWTAGSGDLKPIKKRSRLGKEIPYIELFERTGRKLPIKRVIVGPCRDQTGATEKVRALVGSDIEVEVSDIPFLG